MNTGMRDAFNLAWKLALVVRGEARDILLDSYSEERSNVGDMVLRNASLMTAMATLSNPVALAALRRDAATADRTGQAPAAEAGAPAPDDEVGHRRCPLFAALVFR